MDILSLASAREIGLRERVEQYLLALEVDGNEAQTRFHVIDEFLTSELGWNKSSIRTEAYLESAGFADISLFSAGLCKAVLEAKRDSAELCSIKQQGMSVVPLESTALRGAMPGINQAIGYAARLGSPVGIVSNGRQWVMFLAHRGDGRPPTQGMAVVFPTIDAVISSWARFFSFASEAGLQEQILQSFIREQESGSLPVAVTYYRVFDRGYKKVPQVSELSFDLSEIFRKSFIKINTKSRAALIDCFVETRASRETDVAFEKIVSELLDRAFRRLESIDSSNPESFQGLIESSVELRSGEFVLLVGNKGSGKTTFLDRFFSKVLPASVKEKTIQLGVDLLKAEGSDQRLSDWISFELIKQAERELFGLNPTYDQLRGAFWPQYQRMRTGELAPMYTRDRDAFRERFGEFLTELRKSQPREYLLELLKRSLVGESRLPVLVFDNVDHLPRSTQDLVFQYAVGISSSVASFLVCPVTDTTVWSLSKAGPLQSFHSRAFFLPVPSLREVFAKRLDLLKSELVRAGAQRGVSAIVGKGMRLSIDNVQSFCATVESIFVATSDVTAVIGRLCNYDVRRSLELSGEILASPWIGLEELLRMYVAKGEVRPRRTSLMSALILQKGTIFDEDKHNFLINVFARPSGSLASPLMGLYLLKLLSFVDDKAATTRDRFVSISQLWGRFSGIGVSRDVFRFFIDRFFGRALLEAYDPSERELRDETLVRISPAGAAHLRLVGAENVYLSQMALVTSLTSEAVVVAIKEEATNRSPNWKKVAEIFVEYLLREDARVFPASSSEAYPWIAAVREDIEQVRLRLAGSDASRQARLEQSARTRTNCAKARRG